MFPSLHPWHYRHVDRGLWACYIVFCYMCTGKRGFSLFLISLKVFMMERGLITLMRILQLNDKFCELT